eukprot:CCRYP_000419-RA/>CCRYP_000419-RA protein AED:0.49 eAED:1.00 QI:0/-1/0/1/-1/1/1/0/955
MIHRGHSLPPGVAGSPLGTLKIAVLESTVPHFKSASLEFWGGASTNDIAISEVVDMPLVGTTSSVDKYLQDASPVPIRVKGRTHRNEAHGIIGSSAIPDISFTALIQNTRKPLTVTRRFRLDCASESEKRCIGIIVLDVSFCIDEAAMVADDSFQRREILDNVADFELSSFASFGRGCDVNDGQLNDASMNNAEGQQSLLGELLDLCADDMTIPTLPTIDDTTTSCAASNYVDPFETWISRLEKKAASPVRRDNVLKIEVSDVLLSSDILDRFDGKILVYLSYRIKTKESETSFAASSDWAEEFLLCEHASIAGSKPQRSVKKTKGGDRYISMMGKQHVKAIETKVDYDESIWSRLDREINFCLSCVHSQKRKQENPKQEVHGYSKRSKSNSPPSKNDRICLATAVVNLREVLSPDACITIDMLRSNAHSKTNPRAIKVGSLLVNFSLVPRPLVENSLHKSRHEGMSMSNSYTRTSSELGPQRQSSLHPVSVFLANFANNAKPSNRQDLDVRDKHNFGECAAQRYEWEPPTKHSLEKHNEQDPKCTGCKHGTLQPVRPPPLWISIVVSKIELCSRRVSKNNLKLNVMCSDAISPVNAIREQTYDAQCSWQLTLKEGSNRANVDVDIKLRTSDSLDATAHMGFHLGETFSLPSIFKSGWFDILDSSKTQIGKILIEISVGTLKYARSFPVLCQNTMLIQRWWRRTLAFGKGSLTTIAKSDSECVSKDTRGETKRPTDEASCQHSQGDSLVCTDTKKDASTNNHFLHYTTSSSDSKVMKQWDADMQEQRTPKKVSSDTSSHFSSHLSTRGQQQNASCDRSRGIKTCYAGTKELPVSSETKTDISSRFIHDVDEFLGSSICIKGSNESTSSPDSLFEEWSRTKEPQEIEVAKKTPLAQAQSKIEHIDVRVCGSCESEQKVEQLSPESGHEKYQFKHFSFMPNRVISRTFNAKSTNGCT